jgi:hypothetical protein
MTNLTEIRRPGFEAEYAKKYGKQPGRWGMDQGKYRMEHAEVAWWGYNAALDSVVVELPPKFEDVTGLFSYDADEVLLRLNAAGIKIK